MPLPNLAARRPTVGRTTKRGAFGHIRQHRGPKRGFNQRRSSAWNGREGVTVVTSVGLFNLRLRMSRCRMNTHCQTNHPMN
jgi:hypothetical protein